jgi:hypothetical protein
MREAFLDRRRQEHVVGDTGDFLRISPRGFEHVKFSLEGASLRVLMRRHLECKASTLRQVGEQAGFTALDKSLGADGSFRCVAEYLRRVGG